MTQMSKTRKALLESIEKWDQIARGEMIDMGTENCGLCAQFNRAVPGGIDCEEHPCKGCPVFEDTGNRYCLDTPYEKWTRQTDLEEVFGPGHTIYETVIGTMPCKPIHFKLAQAEADYLRSLLKKVK